MKMTSLIIEDEPIARDIIRNYIGKIPDLDLAGEFRNSKEAFDYLSKETVDVLFLDINIPPITGIDLIKSLADPPPVIFITAYPDYAVEGFELEAVDYLVKPVSFERFCKAIEKLRDKLKQKNNNYKMSFKSNGRTYLVNIEDIIYFQGMGDYIKVVCEGQNLIIADTMKEMENKLADSFIRIHKSYIINKNKVQYLEGNQVKIHDTLIPIGATYREEFKKIF